MQPLIDSLNPGDDYYLVNADFPSYMDANKRVDVAYADRDGWARRTILATASMGKFSSDRSIREYARDIWHIQVRWFMRLRPSHGYSRVHFRHRNWLRCDKEMPDITFCASSCILQTTAPVVRCAVNEFVRRHPGPRTGGVALYSRPASFRLFCKMVSLTIVNTTVMLAVSVAQVSCGYICSPRALASINFFLM